MTSFSFSNCVTSVLDKFAPIKDKIVSLRPAAPWINLVVKAQKQVRRRAERLYRKTRLTVHRQIYQYQRSKTIKVINEEKRKYITNQISNSSNSKQLYSVLKNVTAKSNSLTLPSDTPHQILPNIFNNFFVDKIAKIRQALDSIDVSRSQSNNSSECVFNFDSFSPVDQDYVKKVIMCSRKSFSELDSLPRDLFIQSIDVLIPHITNIFNQSLQSGEFPSDFKKSLDEAVFPHIFFPNFLPIYAYSNSSTFVQKYFNSIFVKCCCSL